MIYGTGLIKNDIFKINLSYFHSDNQTKVQTYYSAGSKKHVYISIKDVNGCETRYSRVSTISIPSC